MNTSLEPRKTPPLQRSIFSRMTLAAFIAGAALAGSIVAVAANGMAAGGFHHGMNASYSAADVTSHVDHVLKHLYVEINATDAQKAQITPLVQQAVSDLLPMHTQLQAAHEQALQALTQNTVDRSALEAARVVHLQLADQASRRLTQLIGDVDELLTPDQRTALAAHLKEMHVKT